MREAWACCTRLHYGASICVTAQCAREACDAPRHRAYCILFRLGARIVGTEMVGWRERGNVAFVTT